MKRFVWLLLITLTLVACSHKKPTPTSSPSPTQPSSPTPVVQATPRPQISPTPRITIVPSATRLQPTPPSETKIIGDSPTSTDEPPPTLIPSATPTLITIDAGATDTPPPTATISDSPLPSPSSHDAPDTLPSDTPSPSATPTLSPTSEMVVTHTPRPTPSDGESPTPTATLTATLPPADEGWSFEHTFIYYDDMFEELYILGKAINNTGSRQHITSLVPILYDEAGNPLTSEEDVYFPPSYDLISSVSLAPGSGVPFSFIITYLPDDLDISAIEDHYDFVIEAEPTDETTRGDLGLSVEGDDSTDWPDYFFLEGIYTVPEPALAQYVTIIVTLYDEDERVIGVGGSFSTDAFDLGVGEHDYIVDVELDVFVYNLGLEMETYGVQLFGY